MKPLLTLCIVSIMFAQEPPPPAENAAAPPAAGEARGGRNTRDPQPYDKVITKDAVSKKGVFTVHQIR